MLRLTFQMITQAFNILEFDALRALVRRGVQTATGREQLDRLGPLSDIDELQRDLRGVAEMIELRRRGARLSFDAITDPTDSISRLKIEGTALEPIAILGLARLCERAMDARAAILAERDTCPKLFEIVAALPGELKSLAARLTKKILPSGELDDHASPQLAGIRRDIAQTRSRITRSLENLMRRSSEAIQEELVTIRNDRFVIPVRSDHRGRINGVAHGSSSSGATVFIEPLETIEANNELQSLREAEEREIAEILFVLSEELRRELPGLELAAKAITELDFVNAKAAFAERFDCVVPEIDDDTSAASKLGDHEKLGCEKNEPRLEPGLVPAGALEFIEARHPLLEESLRESNGKVVPVSFGLDDQNTTMVISGANAGGKTVVLKTAGLLSLMALSGLPVPAKAARAPFYRSVLADIGDHQSIAANLSTFTSHVANIASMIEKCEMPALVLLDEVGTGTDPEEGSALGVVVVDYFKRHGAHVLATTHYSGLKMYASNEPGVLNASVEFDERTLQPTYRLLVGLAGSSSGLEIARRFGIPDHVINRASEHVKQSSLDAMEYLRRIKREVEEAESLRKALEEERAAVAEKFASLDKQAEKQERARRAEFDRQLGHFVADFQKLSSELLAKIEDRAARAKAEREAERRAGELRREAQRAAREMKESSKRSARELKPQLPEDGLPPPLRGVRVIRDGEVISEGRKAPATTPEKPASIRDEQPASKGERDVRAPSVGDRVRLRTFGSIGIVDEIKDDVAEVRVGSLHMREKLENLELVDQASAVRDSGVKSSLEDARRRAQTTELRLHSKAARTDLSTSAELNLIGKKTDEAVELTDKFLDQAFLNGLSEVRIIHGHGTGALRRAIAELLTGHPHVSSITAASPQKGGTGATVVELRK
ncbi:MAG: hypothetical protein AUJ04_08825 [Acidobacteria bacterium 13_1_40CM_3_55_6]|nr:MAG: hypothetical protein AUJ04_08825 [Acidobacteria bacterium 13_1_40CM_3_55_6]